MGPRGENGSSTLTRTEQTLSDTDIHASRQQAQRCLSEPLRCGAASATPAGPGRRRVLAAAAGLVALLAGRPGPAWAQPALQGTLYSMPAGWKEVVQGPARMLVAPVAHANDLLVVLVSPARPAEGAADAQLQSLADAAESKARRLSRGPVQAARRPGLDLLTMPARVDQPGVGEHDRIYGLATDGRRAVFVVVLSRGDDTLHAQRMALAQLLQSIAPAPATAAADPQAARPAAASAEGTGIPYGGKPVNVLDKAFRPSGRGKPFPAPAIVDGAPVGLWWYVYISKYGSDIRTEVYFPDGTATALFRPGGPRLADLEGMHALGDDGFIGRYRVGAGVMSVQWGSDAGNAISRPITLHANGDASSFIWFQREYQPALPVTPQFLAGTWREGAMGTFSFRADGTVLTTPNMIEAQWGRARPDETIQGRWFLDGYLLAMRFPSDGDRVCAAFRTPHGDLVLRQSLLTRQ